MTQTFEDLVTDRFVLGDPAEGAEEIRRWAALTGANTFLFRLHWPGMPHAAVMKEMRLLADKVRPLLT
jgi:alkanesulfonate monooxygenase SsuD/methylene tetrahydromethanopterin reductase-like flavin-dependent oxidoreductase (luciferase family)